MSNHISGVQVRAVGAISACLLALTACSNEATGKAMPKPTDSPSASSNDDLGGLLGDESAAPDPSDPVEAFADAMDGEALVLDHGDEPRRQLAVELTEGQRSVSTMQMTMDTTMNGTKSPSMPITMVVSVGVQEVTDERTTIRATYDDVEIDESGLPRDLVAELESEMAALESIAVTVDQSPTGELLDTRFSLPDNAPASAHQMVEQLAGNLMSYSVPFPAEPVGEGATWSVVETVESNGISMVQTSTYVLEELEGQRYRITTEFGGTFSPMAIGGGVKLAQGSMAGEGETTGVLDQLMPTLGTSEVSTTMVMKAGGRRLESVSDIEMTITTEND